MWLNFLLYYETPVNPVEPTEKFETFYILDFQKVIFKFNLILTLHSIISELLKDSRFNHREENMDLQAPLGNLSSTQKDQLMTEVRQQIAVANAQELVTVSDCPISYQATSNSFRILTSIHLLCRKLQRNAFESVWQSLAQVWAVLNKSVSLCAWTVLWIRGI